MQLSAPIRLVRDILKFAKKRRCPELHKTIRIIPCIDRVGDLPQVYNYSSKARQPLLNIIKAYQDGTSQLEPKLIVSRSVKNNIDGVPSLQSKDRLKTGLFETKFSWQHQKTFKLFNTCYNHSIFKNQGKSHHYHDISNFSI